MGWDEDWSSRARSMAKMAFYRLAKALFGISRLKTESHADVT